MKTFWKVFAVAFLSFTIVFSGLIWSFNRFMKEDESNNLPVVIVDNGNEEIEETEEVDELTRLIRNSDRVNFIILGLDGPRSDMMMFMSFDPESKRLDGLSIPRDTYLVREGYNAADQKKINAAYGAHGATGVKEVVSSLLHNVPIDNYVTLTYKGVGAIVDSIGGVPVYIPKKMEYDDPYSDPPLHIRFDPGNHVLKGADSIKFLRYRQPNKGSGALDRNGDIGRIQAQQDFMKSAMEKILGPKLPNAVATAFKHVKTDIDLQDAMKLAASAAGLNIEDINIHLLPGEARYQGGGSYFFHDSKELKQLLIQIYSGEDKVVEEEPKTNN